MAESVVAVKKVENVLKENVFTELGNGTDIFSFHVKGECIEEVKYSTVDEVLNMIEDDAFVFFKVVESED